MAKSIDWIKLRNEYIHSKISYRKLAAKHKISESSVKKRGKLENWGQLRKEKYTKITAKVSQKTEEKIIDDTTNQIIDLIELGDKLAAKIDEAIDQLGMIKLKDGTVLDIGLIDPYNLHKLVQSLKELNDIKKSNKDDNEDKHLNVTLKWE